MSKVKVGDIVIEGGKISIGGKVVIEQGGASPSPPPMPLSVPEETENSTLAFIERLPLGSRPLIGIGIGVALLGLLGSFLPADPFLPFIGRIPLFVMGLGTVAIGVVKRRLVTEGKRSPEKLLQARITRLKPILAERSPENTIERIVSRVRMTEEAVVETLIEMQKRGMIEEELNLDTGEWYYVFSDAWDEAKLERKKRVMTLEERHRALLQRGKDEE